MKRVNITDVAREAGVSIATASYALRADGRVARKTEEKVLRVAEELGFVRDDVAVRLRTGRSNLIGAVLNDITNPFFSELIAELEISAYERGFLTVLTTTQDDPRRQKRLVSSMISQRVAGLIISPAHGTVPDDLQSLRVRSIPYVVCVRDIGDPDGGFLGADDTRAGRMAVRHMLENGHRNLAFVGGYAHTETWRRRLAGIHSDIDAFGAGNVVIREFPGRPAIEFGHQATNRLLREKSGLTGLVCFNDAVAVGSYQAALSAGVKIGADISVIGFDNIPLAGALLPGLTTIDLFPRSLGRICADLIIDRSSAEKPSKPTTRLISPVLVERGSVAGI